MTGIGVIKPTADCHDTLIFMDVNRSAALPERGVYEADLTTHSADGKNNYKTIF